MIPSSSSPDWTTAQWIGHPSLDPINTRETAQWIERSANDRVMSLNCWKNPPEDLTGKEYATEKMEAMQPAPRFRRTFQIEKEVASATIHYCGLGIHRLSLDGSVVADRELDPRQTQYEKRALYVSRDLTESLTVGEHVLAIELGQGWYSENLAFGNDKHDTTIRSVRERLDAVFVDGDSSAEVVCLEDTPWSYGEPGFILTLDIEFTDGSHETLNSDTSWVCGTGPVLKNSIFSGVFYDARLETPDWNALSFDDSEWLPATVREPLTGSLEPMRTPPERPFAEFIPTQISEPQPGVYVFHFERVFAGWQQLTVEADAGTLLTLQWASQLDENGNVISVADGQETAGAKPMDAYVCKGGGVETWEPHFTYHCGQYVEVRGLKSKPDLGLLKGIAVATDTKTVGTFEASDRILNRIEDALRWTLKSNIHGTINAMSSRERDQWPCQALLNGSNLMFHFDMREIWRESMRDWCGNTNADGIPFDITPSRREFGPLSYTTTAIPTLLRDYHAFYGGAELIEEYFGLAIKGLRLTLNAFAVEPGSNLILGLGDHCDPFLGKAVDKGNIGVSHNSPCVLTASLGYADACRTTARLAKFLGKDGEEKEFNEQAEKTAATIREAYYDSDKKTFGSMMGNAASIQLDIAPMEDIEAILDAIVNEIEERDGAFSTGFFGTPMLLFTLADHGRDDVAYQLMSRTEYPGYGYYLEKFNAHEIWEYWDDHFEGQAPFIGRMQMEKGAGIEYHWRCLGGLRADFDAPGMSRVTLKPSFPKALESAGIEYETGHGKIISQWSRESGQLVWDVTLPESTTAIIDHSIAGDSPVEIASGSHTFTAE